MRCDLVDANVNLLGRDPATGFARRPLDNVGVQYGLAALAAKNITVDQFLDLNESIGGFDIDGNVVPERETATEDALQIVYSKGRISVGGGDQKVVPLVDLNLYDDAAGDIHDRFRAFSLRERLGSPNQVIWTRGGSEISGVNGVIGNIVSGGGGVGDNAIAVLDRWLDAGKMPAAAADNCPGANGTFITGAGIYEKPGPCRDDYPLARRPAYRRRRAAAQRHPEVPTAAREPGRLRGDAYLCPASAPAADLPRRCVRLGQAGRRASSPRRNLAALLTPRRSLLAASR